jgi:hypothetical protein
MGYSELKETVLRIQNGKTSCMFYWEFSKDSHCIGEVALLDKEC